MIEAVSVVLTGDMDYRMGLENYVHYTTSQYTVWHIIIKQELSLLFNLHGAELRGVMNSLLFHRTIKVNVAYRCHLSIFPTERERIVVPSGG